MKLVENLVGKLLNNGKRNKTKSFCAICVYLKWAELTVFLRNDRTIEQ